MRNRFISLSAVFGLMLLAIVGCDSKQEKVQKKLISTMDEYADILADIKSNTDFVNAKPKLEKLGAKMKDLTNEAKDLPKLSADEQKKLDDEFQAGMKKSTDRVQSEMERLMKLGVSPMDVMDSMKMDPTAFSH